MQNLVVRKPGVSPAYFVSRYGARFTYREVAQETGTLKKLGFGHVQLEIADPSVEENWDRKLFSWMLRALTEDGLQPTVFIAHFLGEHSRSAVAMEKGRNDRSVERVLELIAPLDRSVPFAVPLLPLEAAEEGAVPAALELIDRWQRKAAGAGRELILEVLPGSAAGSYSAVLNNPLWKEAAGKAGFLLDTGHAFNAGDPIPELIGAMGGRLKALHLSDADGGAGSSLVPGRGGVSWGAVLESLGESGYRGSLDLEIVSPAGDLEEDYLQGARFIAELLEKTEQREKEYV